MIEIVKVARLEARSDYVLQQAFVSFGVPTCPNGFDVDAINLHRDLQGQGRATAVGGVGRATACHGTGGNPMTLGGRVHPAEAFHGPFNRQRRRAASRA